MTDDARVSAWIMSWQLLDGSNKILNKNGIEHPDVRELHQALISRAKIYSDLSSAPEDVGIVAGEWLREEHERKQEDERMQKIFERTTKNG